MSKVLLVTDYSGNLHITPLGNKTYYQSRNKVVKDKQYKFKEVEEEDANKFVEKNNGIDPDFKTAAQTNKVIEDKDAEIRRLREELAALNDPESETVKLRKQLAEMSTASTSNGEYSKAGANAALQNGQNIAGGAGAGAGSVHGNDDTLKATDLITKINEAKTADEVNSLVPVTEVRVTVLAAKDKKLGELSGK